MKKKEGSIDKKYIKFIKIDTLKLELNFFLFLLKMILYRAICKCLLSGNSGLFLVTKIFLKNEKKTSKNK